MKLAITIHTDVENASAFLDLLNTDDGIRSEHVRALLTRTRAVDSDTYTAATAALGEISRGFRGALKEAKSLRAKLLSSRVRGALRR